MRRSTTVPDVLHFHSQPEGALLSANLGIRTVLSYDYYRFRTDHLRLPTGRSVLYWPYRYMLGKFDRLLPMLGILRSRIMRSLEDLTGGRPYPV